MGKDTRRMERRLPVGMDVQLRRLAAEGRPGACWECGFENRCKEAGCAVMRRVSRAVDAAIPEAKTERRN